MSIKAIGILNGIKSKINSNQTTKMLDRVNDFHVGYSLGKRSQLQIKEALIKDSFTKSASSLKNSAFWEGVKQALAKRK